MRYLVYFLAMALCVYPQGAFAQNDDAYLQRLEIAKKVQEARPVREQVEEAIERYLRQVPEDRRDGAKELINELINYEALKKISLDAYADVYTQEELQAMYEYYSKPESRSAAAKTDQYAEKVFPEIIRMIDSAIMRMKLGG